MPTWVTCHLYSIGFMYAVGSTLCSYNFCEDFSTSFRSRFILLTILPKAHFYGRTITLDEKTWVSLIHPQSFVLGSGQDSVWRLLVCSHITTVKGHSRTVTSMQLYKMSRLAEALSFHSNKVAKFNPPKKTIQFINSSRLCKLTKQSVLLFFQYERLVLEG